MGVFPSFFIYFTGNSNCDLLGRGTEGQDSNLENIKRSEMLKKLKYLLRGVEQIPFFRITQVSYLAYNWQNDGNSVIYKSSV